MRGWDIFESQLLVIVGWWINSKSQYGIHHTLTNATRILDAFHQLTEIETNSSGSRNMFSGQISMVIHTSNINMERLVFPPMPLILWSASSKFFAFLTFSSLCDGNRRTSHIWNCTVCHVCWNVEYYNGKMNVHENAKFCETTRFTLIHHVLADCWSV